MLELLRNATGGWIAKGFIILLVASFGVWGIADIFTGRQGNVLATVGNTDISPFEYQRVFRAEMRTLSQRLGRTIDPSQARALGLDRQVLSRLIAQAALNRHVSDLGLKLSNKTVAENIANNPAFKDSKGNFSRAQFQNALFQSGISEQAYVASERNALLRGQIGRIIETGIKPPEFLLKTLYQFQAEKRQVTYFKVPASAAGPITDPTKVEISGYYDQHKSEFKSPEYRKITVLSVQPADVADTVEVTEKELKQAYAQNADQYGRPEKREILQIAFPTKDQAEKARTSLTTFDDFKALAKKRGLKDSDLTLGLVAKSDIADAKIAGEAFSLPENKISDPVQGALSTAILYVKKIQKGGKTPFKDVAAKLKSSIALERAQEEILNLHDTIEDERGGGANLNEIAKKLSLKSIYVETIDKFGKNEEGIKADDLPAVSGLLTQAFSGAVGEDISPIETSAGGYVWLSVDKIIPSAIRPLERAKADVIARWKEDKRQKKLIAFTDTLIERLKSGESFLKIASEIGSKVKSSKELTRFDSEGALSQAAVAKIFLSRLDEISSASANVADVRVVFKLNDISVPAFDSASSDVKALQKFLTSSYATDLMTDYQTGVRKSIGVTVNQRIWSRVTGGGSENADGHSHSAGDQHQAM